MFKNYFLVALRKLDRQGMYSAINIMGLAVIAKPHLILADEPTGNLDTAAGQEVVELFEELVEEGKTVIVVTHDQDIARRTRRIVRLRDGRVEEDTGAAWPDPVPVGRRDSAC